jgi:hypothetical protein
MPSSQGGRSYSDPSYGSVKTMELGSFTAGTRATLIVGGVKAQNSIKILDWNIVNGTLGTGGSSQWVLAATSSNGTAALGTIIFVGTHAAGAGVDGAVTGTSAILPAGGALNLYSILSTAADLSLNVQITYRETFDSSDN